jgi:hypothetical protein
VFPIDTWQLGMSVEAYCMSLIQEVSAQRAEMCSLVDSAGVTRRLVVA